MTFMATRSEKQPTNRRDRSRRLSRAEFLIPVVALGLLGTIASPHLTQAEDERQSGVAVDARHLQDAINVFRSRAGEGSPYDPFTDGWTPLIAAGLLAHEPVNPITGSSLIVRRASASAGWVFDPESRRLEACVIDPDTSHVYRLQRDH